MRTRQVFKCNSLRAVRKFACWGIICVNVSCATGDDVDHIVLEKTQAIQGGVAVAEGEWSSVVWFNGGKCTGVLIEPQVVLYAGHCGSSFDYVLVGSSFPAVYDESSSSLVLDETPAPDARRAISYCEVHPETAVGSPIDLGVCVLDEPADIPWTPIALGCELSQLSSDTELLLVGYGLTESGGETLGTKRSIGSYPTSLEPTIVTGMPGLGPCDGDSGGPALFDSGEGEWRVGGILSWGDAESCGVGHYSIPAQQLEWIENTTKRDVSPCFNHRGEWEPSAGCFTMFWDRGTEERSDPQPSQVCGAPFDPAQANHDLDVADYSGANCSVMLPRGRGTELVAVALLAGIGAIRRRINQMTLTKDLQ